MWVALAFIVAALAIISGILRSVGSPARARNRAGVPIPVQRRPMGRSPHWR
jgi:hypothetical protein